MARVLCKKEMAASKGKLHLSSSEHFVTLCCHLDFCASPERALEQPVYKVYKLCTGSISCMRLCLALKTFHSICDRSEQETRAGKYTEIESSRQESPYLYATRMSYGCCYSPFHLSPSADKGSKT